MRTLTSREKELAQLRDRHTKQCEAGQWVEAQTTRQKIINALDGIVARWPNWKEKEFSGQPQN